MSEEERIEETMKVEEEPEKNEVEGESTKSESTTIPLVKEESNESQFEDTDIKDIIYDEIDDDEEETLLFDDREIDSLDSIEKQKTQKNYKNLYAQSEEFMDFQRVNPSVKISIRTSNKLKKLKSWEFYRKGIQKDPLKRILMIPSLLETMDTYYRQINILHAKGYEVIACNPPPCDSIEEWIVQFKNFLSKLGIPSAHMYGTGLGGYLLQCFAEMYPRYVNSLILVNSFQSTSYWSAKLVFPDITAIMPKPVLRLLIESIFPNYKALEDKRAYEFMIEQLNSLDRKTIHSRINLNILQTDKLKNDDFPVPEDHIAVIYPIDQTIIPSHLQARMKKKYTNSKFVELRSGSDFPHLTNSDEIILHIEVHVRQVIQRMDEATRPVPIPYDDDEEEEEEKGMNDHAIIELSAKSSTEDEEASQHVVVEESKIEDEQEISTKVVQEEESSKVEEQPKKGFFDDDDDDDENDQFDELMKQHL